LAAIGFIRVVEKLSQSILDRFGDFDLDSGLRWNNIPGFINRKPQPKIRIIFPTRKIIFQIILQTAKKIVETRNVASLQYQRQIQQAIKPA